MKDEDFEAYLMILDKSAIASREHFMVECAAAGLRVDDNTFDEVIKREVEFLKNIKKIADMFDDDPIMAVMTYKKIFRLVASAGIETDPDSFSKRFCVKYIGENEIIPINITMDMMDDMSIRYGIDVDGEIWNCLQYEGLKR